MDNHDADRPGIRPSLNRVFNIVRQRLRICGRPETGKPGDFLAQYLRVIVASLASKRNKS